MLKNCFSRPATIDGSTTPKHYKYGGHDDDDDDDIIIAESTDTPPVSINFQHTDTPYS